MSLDYSGNYSGVCVCDTFEYAALRQDTVNDCESDDEVIGEHIINDKVITPIGDPYDDCDLNNKVQEMNMAQWEQFASELDRVKKRIEHLKKELRAVTMKHIVESKSLVKMRAGSMKRRKHRISSYTFG